MSIVTCHTDGCPAAGRPVPMDLMWVTADGESRQADAVICGSCQQLIDDVTESDE